MRRALVLSISALALSACDGGGDPVQQALREASAEHHARAVREGLTPAPETGDLAAARRLADARRRALAETRAVPAEDPELRRLAEDSAARDAETLARLEAWIAAR